MNIQLFILGNCEETCGENEEFASCASACHDSCAETPKVCTDNCYIGCVCKKGYVRQTKDIHSKCIQKEKC